MVDEHDRACAMAHGDLEPDAPPRTLAVVFASPVARYLLHFGRDLGYRTLLVEPDLNRVTATDRHDADAVVLSADGADIDGTTDVVVTDHDRPELGPMLGDVLALPARWVGVMGSPRHTAPHLAALRDLGAAESDIDRVHRPIGLNIGSKSPAEIAVATLAGLLADRNGRPGGFQF